MALDPSSSYNHMLDQVFEPFWAGKEAQGSHQKIGPLLSS